MEYFSSDEQSNVERGTDANSLSLDANEDDHNYTAGTVLKQSDDLNFSDSDLNLSQQSSTFKSSPSQVHSSSISKPT